MMIAHSNSLPQRPCTIVAAVVALPMRMEGAGQPFGPDELFAAVEANDASLAEHILASGVPVDCRDHKGRTPFMMASLRGHDAVHRVLLHAHADLNAKDHRGIPAHVYNQCYGAQTIANVARLEAMAAKATMEGMIQRIQNPDKED